MLKKTLIATAAIGATLLAAALWLPAVAQPGSGAAAVNSTTTARPSADSARQDRRDAAPGSRSPKSELHHERTEGDTAGEEGVDGRAGEHDDEEDGHRSRD